MIGRWNRKPYRLPEHRRQEMIDHHSRFLTWALRNGVEFPRIPRRRVDEGGFGYLRKMQGAKEMVDRWWGRTLELVESVSERR